MKVKLPGMPEVPGAASMVRVPAIASTTSWPAKVVTPWLSRVAVTGAPGSPPVTVRDTSLKVAESACSVTVELLLEPPKMICSPTTGCDASTVGLHDWTIIVSPNAGCVSGLQLSAVNQWPRVPGFQIRVAIGALAESPDVAGCSVVHSEDIGQALRAAQNPGQYLPERGRKILLDLRAPRKIAACPDLCESDA